MKHPFQALPKQRGRARPVVDLVVDGLALAPQACLVDTGAAEVRMGLHVAELAGVDLDGGVIETIVVGGLRTTGRAATVELAFRQEHHPYVWSQTVFFCDPWPWAFGLLGLSGLEPFVFSIDAYEEWSELTPVDRSVR